MALGFAYWLVFLLALVPDNIMRAIAAQQVLLVDLEVLRIVTASALGAAVTPLVFLMVRSFPVAGAVKLRNAMGHMFGLVTLAFLLILASVMLANRLLPSSLYPLSADLAVQLKANMLVLTFCLVGLSAIAHAKYFSDQSAGQPASIRPAFLSHVTVKNRGRLICVNLEDVMWIESQGNYLALHTSETTHLIREPMTSFCAKLDPSHFIRVHRGVTVALNAVQDMSSLSGGDATLTLMNDTKLRVSRTYSASLRTALIHCTA